MSNESNNSRSSKPSPPTKDQFVKEGILCPNDANWVWHKPTNSPQYILAIEEIYKHHFALVLGDPDGSFSNVETFHDSDDQFLRYPPSKNNV